MIESLNFEGSARISIGKLPIDLDTGLTVVMGRRVAHSRELWLPPQLTNYSASVAIASKCQLHLAS